jgi:predicted DCC family thiol-disulfide oxidoreductase YuxK
MSIQDAHLSRDAVNSLKESGPTRGWVLYDDSCGFCRRWVPFWASTIRHRGYAIAPLQSKWVTERLKLSDDVLIEDLRLLLVDGTQVQGADVYRHVMRRIWWAYPLFLLACTPGLRRLFDLGYRTFAINRFRFSSACGLRRDAPPSPDADFDIPHR